MAMQQQSGQEPKKILPSPVTIETTMPISTGLTRAALLAQPDLPLWWLIKKSTKALSFDNYMRYTDIVFCGDTKPLLGQSSEKIVEGCKGIYIRRFLPFTDTDAYRLLKVATEAFLKTFCGVVLEPPAARNRSNFLKDLAEFNEPDIDPDKAAEKWYEDYLKDVAGTNLLILPYLESIRNKLPDVPIRKAQDILDITGEEVFPKECYGILEEKLAHPCLVELIWSYWHEQGMLVQTMNAIGRRFQNIRGPAEKDPLAMMELDPLRPLNNLLWGYIQDEQHRLPMTRRVYEYDHHYGLTLEGRAVPLIRPADSRSKFLEAFHNLLHLCSGFFKQDDDTTVVSDAFPVLVALRDVHMLLAEGAHNQFGDLPVTARIEMLMQQWLLARPEFREALPTRTMVDYPEPWMERVDAMKRLQGWTDTNVMHFHDLGTYGEQILLSIRFGCWNDATPAQAKQWARFWRSAIQSYVHSYNIVTGVDLTADIAQAQQRRLVFTQPSILLRQRLPGNGTVPALTAGSTTVPATNFRERRVTRS